MCRKLRGYAQKLLQEEPIPNAVRIGPSWRRWIRLAGPNYGDGSYLGLELQCKAAYLSSVVKGPQ